MNGLRDVDETMTANAEHQQSSNTDLCLWALYSLGAAEKAVDVEDIYLKLFEIAPKKFGWRTKPELPNFQKAHQALGRLEKNVRPDFIIKASSNTRMISSSAKKWIEENLQHLSELGDSRAVVAPPSTDDSVRAVRALKASSAWKGWEQSGSFELGSLADSLVCSPVSAFSVWHSRLAKLNTAAEFLADERVSQFVSEAEAFVRSEHGIG